MRNWQISHKRGFVTLTPAKRKKPAAAIFSDGSNHGPPSIHRLRTGGAVRSGGYQVALDVEGVVDGGVSGEKSLG